MRHTYLNNVESANYSKKEEKKKPEMKKLYEFSQTNVEPSQNGSKLANHFFFLLLYRPLKVSECYNLIDRFSCWN